ncbi:hypothetical protein [Vibrio sp. TBV020]|uniref:hypothetical protein n=1 Tax=Vibrio sp. TBV020 TaxID=3137398 RepID=UPI0038CD4975
MKVILLSYHYLPEITPRAFRASSLYEMLTAQGHDVELIVPTSAAEGSSSSSGYGGSKLKSSIRKGVERLLPGGKDLKALPFFYRALKGKQADLILSIGLPFSVHLAVALAKTFANTKAKATIFDYGDPYSQNPNGNQCFYATPLEKWVLKSCNYVMTPVEAAIPAFEKLVSKQVGPQISVVPQGYDLHNVNIAEYCPNQVPTFCYAGILYKGIREPRNFLKFLSLLEIDFRFVVYTNTASSENMQILEEYKQEFGNRIEIHSLIPREQCIYELSQADFLINFANKGGVQQPSKLIDYTLSKRPFLSIDSDQQIFAQFESFLAGDFSQFVPFDVSRYDQKLVAEKVVCLAEEAMVS